MLEHESKFSSTEGYYGEGVYREDVDYKLYNKEHFFKILKKNLKKPAFFKNVNLPNFWHINF